MITRKNLDKLYDWATGSSFPLKKAPTSTNYSNKDIYICGLKFVRKNINIKKNLMTNEVYNIIKDDDILFDNYSIEKFHFHVKIKYGINGLVVKFYNTYPINPFLNYYDNKKKFR